MFSGSNNWVLRPHNIRVWLGWNVKNTNGTAVHSSRFTLQCCEGLLEAIVLRFTTDRVPVLLLVQPFNFYPTRSYIVITGGGKAFFFFVFYLLQIGMSSELATRTNSQTATLEKQKTDHHSIRACEKTEWYPEESTSDLDRPAEWNTCFSAKPLSSLDRNKTPQSVYRVAELRSFGQ